MTDKLLIIIVFMVQYWNLGHNCIVVKIINVIHKCIRINSYHNEYMNLECVLWNQVNQFVRKWCMKNYEQQKIP